MVYFKNFKDFYLYFKNNAYVLLLGMLLGVTNTDTTQWIYTFIKELPSLVWGSHMNYYALSFL